MSKRKLDYIRQVEIEYDPDAIIGRGPIHPITWEPQKAVNNAAPIRVLDLKKERVGFCIQAKACNTGKVYLGFDNTVNSIIWFAELQAGMAFCDNSYTGAIWARADVIDNQFLGCSDW